MDLPVHARRCAIVTVEPSGIVNIDLAGLLRGDAPLRRTGRWLAHAPHLDDEVELDAEAMLALVELDETEWTPWDTLRSRHSGTALAHLLGNGLLIGDHVAHEPLRARDETLRNQHWHPLSAVAHYCTRWDRVAEGENVLVTRHRPVEELNRRYGEVPAHQIERSSAAERIPLPSPEKTPLDRLLERRVTCRNFDRDAAIGAETLGAMLKRMIGALTTHEVAAGALMFKKTYPSGGGLHPIEAYVLVRRADGIATGMYHYHAGQHALEPIRLLAEEEADRAALSFVAEQHFFADAQVLVALAARFRRTYWKYRRHSKVYRVVVLEAGHISQNMYLAATELGLGAWITAAINDVQIEEAFALDGIEQSPIAVCGFGIRAPVQTLYEFDPLHAVWPADPAS